MDEYSGPDRRKESPRCDRHDAMVHALELRVREDAVMSTKLADLKEIVDGVQEMTVKNNGELIDLKRIVTNGLSDRMKRIEELQHETLTHIKEVCDRHKDHTDRIEELESFAWFRDWVTGLRASTFKWFVKGIMITVIALLLLQAADKGLIAIIRAARELFFGP